jgi:tetratricopeptide (TPR) repeat protein
VLVIIDDVGEVEDVRQLLPTGPGCAIITCRRPLPKLESDLQMPVPPLDKTSGIALLSSIVGPERVAAAPQAAGRIVGLVRYHPLALRLAGAALSRRPHWGLDQVVEKLANRSPTALTHTDFAGALDLSYGLLTTDERRALCQLGLREELSFAPWMLAALLGDDYDEDTVWRITDRLAEAGLVIRSTVDNAGLTTFRILEHVHRYARARLLAETTEEQRQKSIAALGRAQSIRTEQTVGTDLLEDIYVVRDSGDLNRAMDMILAALALARDNGDRGGEGLALATLAEFKAEVGNVAEATELADAALRLEHPFGRIRALRCHALIERRRRQIPAALGHLDHALSILSAGDTSWSATQERVRILRERAIAQAFGAHLRDGFADLDLVDEIVGRAVQGRLLRAGACWARGAFLDLTDNHPDAERALADGRRVAEDLGQRWWLAWLAHAEARLALEVGEARKCRSWADTAIDLFASMQDRYGAAQCRLLLGKAYLRDDRTVEASAPLEEALHTLRDCEDEHLEALTLKELAEVRLDQGRFDEAIEMLRTADRSLHDLGDLLEQGMVQHRLHELGVLDSPATTYWRA